MDLKRFDLTMSEKQTYIVLGTWCLVLGACLIFFIVFFAFVHCHRIFRLCDCPFAIDMMQFDCFYSVSFFFSLFVFFRVLEIDYSFRTLIKWNLKCKPTFHDCFHQCAQLVAELKWERDAHLQFDVLHLLAFMFHVVVCSIWWWLQTIEHSEQFKVDEKMCKYRIIFIEDIRSAKCQSEHNEQCKFHIPSRHIRYWIFGLCLYCFHCENRLKNEAIIEKSREKQNRIHDSNCNVQS